MNSKIKKTATVVQETAHNARDPRAVAQAAVKEAKRRQRRHVADQKREARAGETALAARRMKPDTVEYLYRRRQISETQRQAALLYRHAWDVCRAPLGCLLKPDHVGGSSAPGSPTEAQLLGARRISDAAHILGVVDNQLVVWITCEGLSVREASVEIFGRYGAMNERDVGVRFRLALQVLADAWFLTASSIRNNRPHISGVRFDVSTDDPPPPQTDRVIERGRAIHATRTRIYESK